MPQIIDELKVLSDQKYKKFQTKIIKEVDPDTIIAVKTPLLKSYAKEMFLNGDYDKFLSDLPHFYFEENQIHVFLLNQITDFDTCVKKVDEFLPYINNWSTSDSLFPKVLKNNKEKLLEYINKWIKSSHPYTIRFSIYLLMRLYLKEDFKIEYLEMVKDVKSHNYYVKMMQAWYFQNAIVHQYEYALEYLKDHKLERWVERKTISKCIDSFLVSEEKKEILKEIRNRS